MANKTIIKEKDLAILVMIHRLKLVIRRDELERRYRLKRGGAVREHGASMCGGFNGSYLQFIYICLTFFFFKKNKNKTLVEALQFNLILLKFLFPLIKKRKVRFQASKQE